MTGERHFHEVLLAISNAFAHGTDHVTGFADADADLTAFVADNNDGAEAHLLTAFHGFGDTSDLHHPFLPFGVTLLVSAVSATSATAVTTVATTTTLLLLLTFGRCRDVGRCRDGVGVGLRVGIGHGLSRNQN